MTEQNGERPSVDLDLTPYGVETFTVRIAEAEYRISADIPLSLALRTQRQASVLSALTNVTEMDEEQAVALETVTWDIASEVLRHAVPPVERPAREIMTLAGAIALLGFLGNIWAGRASSTTSLSSPISTEAPLVSVTSSAARRSTRRPSA